MPPSTAGKMLNSAHCQSFSDERKHGHSPDDVSSWLSFAVFTANSLLISLPSPGKSWIFDRSADPEGKRQLAIFQCGSRQSGHNVGDEALLGEDFCYALIVQFVGARYADTA